MDAVTFTTLDIFMKLYYKVSMKISIANSFLVIWTNCQHHRKLKIRFPEAAHKLSYGVDIGLK